MNQALSKEMLLFFERYLAFYNEFCELETEKYKHITDNAIDMLPDYVKKDEVYFLKSRSIEKEREKLMDKAGLSHLTFQQMIPFFEESTQNDIKGIYIALSKVLLDLKAVNQLCNSVIALRLHRVKSELQKLDSHPEMRKTYDDKAHCSGVSQRTLSQSV